jgi:hypothetical protein
MGQRRVQQPINVQILLDQIVDTLVVGTAKPVCKLWTVRSRAFDPYMCLGILASSASVFQ